MTLRDFGILFFVAILFFGIGYWWQPKHVQNDTKFEQFLNESNLEIDSLKKALIECGEENAGMNDLLVAPEEMK